MNVQTAEKLKKQEYQNRLRHGRCSKCGEDIFYLELEDSPRSWWHEKVSLDFKHKAVPK